MSIRAAGRAGHARPLLQVPQELGGGERVGVMLAEDLALAGEAVAKESKGSFEITCLVQEEGQIVHRHQRVRVLLAQHARRRLQHPLLEPPRPRVIALDRKSVV